MATIEREEFKDFLIETLPEILAEDKAFANKIRALLDGQTETGANLQGIADRLGAFQQETRDNFDQVDQRLDQVDRRLDQVDRRFIEIDDRFAEIIREMRETRSWLELASGRL